MPDHSVDMLELEEPVKGPATERIWQWTTGVLLSFIIGLVSGQFMPNRSIVTRDDLAGVSGQISSLAAKVDQQSADLSEMRGELRARREIEGK